MADAELKKKIDDLYDMFKQTISGGSAPSGGVPTSATRVGRRGVGGRRPPFIKNAILSIMRKEPQWFVEKNAEEVAEKLKTEYGVPGVNLQPVRTALVRFFTDHLLTRKESGGKYLYSVVPLKQT